MSKEPKSEGGPSSSVVSNKPPPPQLPQCYLCKKQFGTASLGIHQAQCYKKALAVHEDWKKKLAEWEWDKANPKPEGGVPLGPKPKEPPKPAPPPVIPAAATTASSPTRKEEKPKVTNIPTNVTAAAVATSMKKPAAADSTVASVHVDVNSSSSSKVPGFEGSDSKSKTTSHEKKIAPSVEKTVAPDNQSEKKGGGGGGGNDSSADDRAQLKIKISNRDKAIARLEKSSAALEEKLSEGNKVMEDLTIRLAKTEANLKESETKLLEKSKALEAKEGQIKDLIAKLNTATKASKDIEAKLLTKEKSHKELEKKIQELTASVASSTKATKELETKNSEAKKSLQNKDKKLTEMTNNIAKKDVIIKQLESKLDEILTPFASGDPCRFSEYVTEQRLLTHIQKHLMSSGGIFHGQSRAQRPVAGFKAVAVQVPLLIDGLREQNEKLAAAFNIRLQALSGLREATNGQSLFNFMPENGEQSDALELLKAHFHKKSGSGGSNTPTTTTTSSSSSSPTGKGSREANTLYAFHGCSADVAESIMKYGFVDLASASDAGWFGRGVYLTLNIEYACQYAAGFYTPQGKQPPKPHPKHSTWFPVVMCAVCVGMAYPITRSKDYPSPGGRPDGHSKHYGQPLLTSFDAHFAPVHSGEGFEVVKASMAEYGELVLSQYSAIYPMAVIWVEADS